MEHRTIAPLKVGDKVAIVAPAGRVDLPQLAAGLAVLESWGLVPVAGPHVGRVHGPFAGTDDERLSDLQQALDDPQVKAVFAARGGYGCTRLVDRLDFSGFARAPKWVVGYSDITVLHARLHELGFQSLHAPMPTAYLGGRTSDQALEALRQTLFGGSLSVAAGPCPENVPGEATAPVTGGNLSLLVAMIGTEDMPKTAGKILFLEEVGEQHYRIDRMMGQLLRAGLLTDLAGLAVGSFNGFPDDDEPFTATAYGIVSEHTARFGYPAAFGLPAGHQAVNFPVLLGGRAKLVAGPAGAGLTWASPKES